MKINLVDPLPHLNPKNPFPRPHFPTPEHQDLNTNAMETVDDYLLLYDSGRP